MIATPEKNIRAKNIEQSLIKELEYQQRQVNTAFNLLGENSAIGRLAKINYNKAYNNLKDFQKDNLGLLEL